MANSDIEVAANDPSLSQTLIKIWASALNLAENNVHIDNTFFELNGDSISGLIVCNQIKKELNSTISLGELFELQSLRNLIQFLSEIDEQE